MQRRVQQGALEQAQAGLRGDDEQVKWQGKTTAARIERRAFLQTRCGTI
jgi:hypothetical protein